MQGRSTLVILNIPYGGDNMSASFEDDMEQIEMQEYLDELSNYTIRINHDKVLSPEANNFVEKKTAPKKLPKKTKSHNSRSKNCGALTLNATEKINTQTEFIWDFQRMTIKYWLDCYKLFMPWLFK